MWLLLENVGPFFGLKTIYKLPVDKTKESAVCFIFFGFFLFFLSGEMDFRSGGARRGGREERNANRKISNQRREKNPALRWNVGLFYFSIFLTHTPVTRDSFSRQEKRWVRATMEMNEWIDSRMAGWTDRRSMEALTVSTRPPLFVYLL